MNHLWAIFIVGLCASTILAERVNYNGHRVIEVVPKSRESLRLLEKLESSGVIKFWVEPTTLNRPTSFQVSPGHYKLINRMLKRDGLSPTVLIDNIQKLIEKQDKEILARQKINHADGKAFDFENYHRYSELLNFMQETAANNSIVSYSVIGSSYEGRDIGQVTLRVGNDPNKEAIFLECGIHAREWVSPAACIWIFDQLANGYGTDPDITRLLDLYDWIIIPSTNPDGYEYCWTDDRLWRKNRRPSSGFPNCPGVDLNRNYDANFGGDGSSAVPCSETYHGASAFSESESIAVRDSLEAHRGFIKAYVSIHSYGGLWMSPYGYRPDVPVEYDEMYRVMAIGVAAIEATYNKDFTFGDEASILYLTSGTSRDYSYVGQDIKYPYTIETRGESYGFVAPPSEILPTAEEIWNGIKAMARSLV